MRRWLFKNEPDCFSFDQLVAEGSTGWDGVNNALAKKHLAACRPGDEVLYYHTGKEKRVVGLARVRSNEDGLVTVEALRALPRPVTLAEIKADGRFAEWELVRLARLSVMPAPDALFERVLEMAGG